MPAKGFSVVPASAAGGGSGDFVGPASAVDGNLVLFDGTTGKLGKDGGAPGGGGGGLVTTAVVKAADETVTSSVTLQADDELALAVAASAVYLFELYLLLEAASNTPDVQYGFTLPAGASLSQTAWGVDVAQTVAPGAAASNNVGQAASASQQATPTAARGYGITNGNFAGLLAKGVVRTSTTPGTLTLQWAQRVSDPAGTVVKADSYLSLTRVS